MSAPIFEIDSHLDHGEGCLALAGEFDLAAAPRVEEAAERLIAQRPERLVVDLSALRFIDSSGLRVLVVLHQRASQEGWTLELVRPEQPVLKVFQISGLEERLHFIDSGAGSSL